MRRFIQFKVKPVFNFPQRSGQESVVTERDKINETTSSYGGLE